MGRREENGSDKEYIRLKHSYDFLLESFKMIAESCVENFEKIELVNSQLKESKKANALLKAEICFLKSSRN